MNFHHYHDENKRGTIERLSYMTKDQEGTTVSKYAHVHLPFGYSTQHHYTVKETTAAIGPDIRKQVDLVIRETQKGRGPEDIAKRYGMDAAVAEQIARLYVTHPGVTTDGIMTKMGL